ncbi:Somatostatin receptor type 1 [Halotydeus destructor]|nr:Somatostatin receptor type 1 [Halotydeus destructor]
MLSMDSLDAIQVLSQNQSDVSSSSAAVAALQLFNNCSMASGLAGGQPGGNLTMWPNGTCEDHLAGGDGGGGGPLSTNYPLLVLEFAKILYGIVCLVGLCGNTLVIYVVLRFSKMQTVTNMYIFNLAVADEMFLVGLPFLIATVTYKQWPFGHVMCKIYMTTTSINQFTSSLLLTVMSADRYVAVCHPISSPRYRTPFIAKFICLTVWTVSALLMVPIFMYANIIDTETTSSCNIIWPESEIMNGQKAFTLYSFTLGFFIPFVLILLFYFLVICKLRTVGPKHKSKEKKKSHRKVTYLVLTVITVYVMCWLPYWIGQVYITFQTPGSGQRHPEAMFTLLLLVGCLSYANSAINPILYAFLSENFKKSFAKAFVCAAGHDVNAQLHIENSVLPRHARAGSSRGPDQRSNRRGVSGDGFGGQGGTSDNRLGHTFVDHCDPQAFSNFVVQESQEIELDAEPDECCIIEPDPGISMTSRSNPFAISDRENLLQDPDTRLSEPTAV